MKLTSTMKLATLLQYDVKGVWQRETNVALRQTGLSRTSLMPEKEYSFELGRVKLGPGKEPILTDIVSQSLKGTVCCPYEEKQSPRELYELAIKAGAAAFVDSREFELPDNIVYPIPAFIISPSKSFNFNTIRLDDEACSVNKEEESNSEKGSHMLSPFSEWIQSKGVTVSQEVIQKWERCGVRTVDDAAIMFLDQEEEQRARMLEARAQEEAARAQEEAARTQEEAARAQEEASSRVLFPKNFSLKDIGVGGLGDDFEVVFRRLFTSRMFSASKLRALGIAHVKGLILSGPPGCGKTLLARRLCKLLNTRKTTVLSGPEIFNKWFGNSEENVRNLFKDAEAEWQKKGEGSGLHVVIIDEIDAMCGKRSSGASNGSSGQRATDSVVNQLLAKMDGVEQINNILLIGLTNRKETIDPALLRPGRFELQLEISLPDEAGRLEILEIHSQSMRQEGLMDSTAIASLAKIAKETEHFSGAELESIVKGACSYAMDRCMDPTDFSCPPDESKLKLESSDFWRALQVVRTSKTGGSSSSSSNNNNIGGVP